MPARFPFPLIHQLLFLQYQNYEQRAGYHAPTKDWYHKTHPEGSDHVLMTYRRENLVTGSDVSIGECYIL